MSWQNLTRPGQFGEQRDQTYALYNQEYGVGNWRIRWLYDSRSLGFKGICAVYETAYLEDSHQREDLWKALIERACEVYDHEREDLKSGLNYASQRTKATHIQDIAIRNVLKQRGWQFTGSELIQVNGKSVSELGRQFSPGKVPFCKPYLIERPQLEGWWNVNSVEALYQSNKWLQVKEKELF